MSKTAIGHFMNQKSFHPAAYHNQKRVWEAQQQAKADIKKRKERDHEYAKEQSLFESKGFALMTREENAIEKARHAVNFMYDAPPGFEKKEIDHATGEEKLTLDQARQMTLQQKFDVLKGAPRPDFAKDNPSARDKPFGVEIRDVRCFKCGQFGHQNTDRVCPMYGEAKVDEDGDVERNGFEDPVQLMARMKGEGFALTKRVLGRVNNPDAALEQYVMEEEVADPEVEFLAGLSAKEKKKLFKKLDKLEKKKKKKKGKEKKRKKSKKRSKDGSSDSDSSEDERRSSKRSKRSPTAVNDDDEASSSRRDDWSRKDRRDPRDSRGEKNDTADRPSRSNRDKVETERQEGRYHRKEETSDRREDRHRRTEDDKGGRTEAVRVRRRGDDRGGHGGRRDRMERDNRDISRDRRDYRDTRSDR